MNIRITGSWAGGSPDDNFGMNVDFFQIEQVLGNRNANVNWWVTKQGTTAVSRDTIYVPARDTIYYEILY
jgi:hypothetical protein